MNTTEGIYLNAKEITNLQQTVSDMLGKLITETKKNSPEENYTQLVVQLNPDIEYGKEWKMFIYYNQDNDTFTYSYQDQDYWDFDLCPSNTREFMLAKVLEEAKAVGGIQWIALDF